MPQGGSTQVPATGPETAGASRTGADGANKAKDKDEKDVEASAAYAAAQAAAYAAAKQIAESKAAARIEAAKKLKPGHPIMATVDGQQVLTLWSGRSNGCARINEYKIHSRVFSLVWRRTCRGPGSAVLCAAARVQRDERSPPGHFYRLVRNRLAGGVHASLHALSQSDVDVLQRLFQQFVASKGNTDLTLLDDASKRSKAVERYLMHLRYAKAAVATHQVRIERPLGGVNAALDRILQPLSDEANKLSASTLRRYLPLGDLFVDCPALVLCPDTPMMDHLIGPIQHILETPHLRQRLDEISVGLRWIEELRPLGGAALTDAPATPTNAAALISAAPAAAVANSDAPDAAAAAATATNPTVSCFACSLDDSEADPDVHLFKCAGRSAERGPCGHTFHAQCSGYTSHLHPSAAALCGFISTTVATTMLLVLIGTL